MKPDVSSDDKYRRAPVNKRIGHSHDRIRRPINLKPVLTRHYQGQTLIIRRLYKERHQAYPDYYLSEGSPSSEKYREPPVVWKAAVFDIDSDRIPAAIYCDDRPLEFKPKHGKAEQQLQKSLIMTTTITLVI